MTKLFHIIWLNFVLGLTGLFGSADTLSLTQATAVELALQKNLSIRIKEISPLIKEQMIRSEKGSFDPNLNVSYSESFDGSNDGGSFNATLRGTTPTGTSYNIGINSKESTTNQYSHSIHKGLTLTQPLLQDFGIKSNWAFVRIAKKQHEQSKWELQQTVLDTIYQVVYAYNAYFLARQNTDIATRNRDLAKKLVSDNKKRIDQGMMSPVDIAVAKAELAVREERVLINNGKLQILENNLKKLVLNNFSESLDTTIEISNLPEAIKPDVQLARDFEIALQKQPTFRIREMSQEIELIRLNRARNQQLFNVSVEASIGKKTYGNSPFSNMDQLGDGDTESSIGLRFNHPILNRQSRAETAISNLRLNQENLKIEQQKHNILLDIHSQIVMVETNWKRIQASRNARELSNQMLEAEQKKLQAGTSSTFVVLRLQNDVANAQIREFQAISDYNLSLAHLGRLKGVM